MVDRRKKVDYILYAIYFNDYFSILLDLIWICVKTYALEDVFRRFLKFFEVLTRAEKDRISNAARFEFLSWIIWN